LFYTSNGWYFTDETAFNKTVFQLVNGFIITINVCPENNNNHTSTTTANLTTTTAFNIFNNNQVQQLMLQNTTEFADVSSVDNCLSLSYNRVDLFIDNTS
jgi:hypothetical protein